MRYHREDDERKWEITFTDMLTLLLTFFVFIIAVSTFKTTEYKKFWEVFESKGKRRPPSASFAVGAIEGIKLPRLNREAEALLNELEQAFVSSDFQGVDVHYTENKISLVVSEEITFDGGQAILKEPVKPLLRELVPVMQASKFNVSVEGHSDILKNERIDNMDLSLDRALSVARFLIANGLDKSKISVSGYGPHRPIADNNSQEGRQRNRRVEVNIMINND